MSYYYPMKTFIHILTLSALVAIAALGCGQSSDTADTTTPETTFPYWLKGSWEYLNTDSPTYERWVTIDSTTLDGFGFGVTDGDTTTWERLQITDTDSGLYYIAIVGHSPDPVGFKLTEHDKTTLVFENPDHDFPTSLTYTRHTNDSVTVTVAGPSDSGLIARDIHLRRFP